MTGRLQPSATVPRHPSTSSSASSPKARACTFACTNRCSAARAQRENTALPGASFKPQARAQGKPVCGLPRRLSFRSAPTRAQRSAAAGDFGLLGRIGARAYMRASTRTGAFRRLSGWVNSMSDFDVRDRVGIASAAEMEGVSRDTIKRRLRTRAYPGAVREGTKPNSPWLIPVGSLRCYRTMPTPPLSAPDTTDGDRPGPGERSVDLRVAVLEERARQLGDRVRFLEALLSRLLDEGVLRHGVAEL